MLSFFFLYLSSSLFDKLHLLGDPTKWLKNILVCNRLTGDGLASERVAIAITIISYEEDHTINTVAQVNTSRQLSRQLCLIFPTLEQVAFIFFWVKQL